MMEVQDLGEGRFSLRQTFDRPRIYLDHWALRHLSQTPAVQDRFIAALNSAAGTWLISAANLIEFCSVEDRRHAVDAEALLTRAFPRVQVADTMAHLWQGENWVLTDLLRRTAIARGQLNARGFFQDTIDHREDLLPRFSDLKAHVARATQRVTADPAMQVAAKKFRPSRGMTLRTALENELMRNFYLDRRRGEFNEHDVLDFIHASSAIPVCDFVLLDAGWCHLARTATQRLSKAGITARMAECFNSRELDQFLTRLEAAKIGVETGEAEGL